MACHNYSILGDENQEYHQEHRIQDKSIGITVLCINQGNGSCKQPRRSSGHSLQAASFSCRWTSCVGPFIGLCCFADSDGSLDSATLLEPDILMESDTLLTDVLLVADVLLDVAALLDAALLLYTVHRPVLACPLFTSLFVTCKCYVLFFSLQNSIKACRIFDSAPSISSPLLHLTTIQWSSVSAPRPRDKREAGPKAISNCVHPTLANFVGL